MAELGSRQRPSVPLPTSGWPLLLLLTVFLLAGTLGHDPWKIEDAAHFGVVWRALAADDWLNFRFATGAVVEPPLYYWVGGAFGQLLSPALAWPDAVRLASPLFAALACAMLYLAGREWYGADAAGAAPLALVGSLGFLVQSHETQPMMATLAAISATYAGLALGPRRTWNAGALIGAGGAGLVLAHGVTLLPALLLGIVTSIVVSPARANSARAALIGIGIAAVPAALWTGSLHATSPAVLDAWRSAELAQFGATADPLGNALRLTKILVWFAWPGLPLAAWGLWTNRRRLADPAQALPLAALALMLANLLLTFEARAVTTLAVLPALAILAVPGTLALRRGAANAFEWFGRTTFGLAAGLIWLGWTAMSFGVPPAIARNFAKLAPGFETAVNPAATTVAVLASAFWLWLILARDQPSSRSPLRPLANWVGGVTLLWLLTTTLWLPWIEHGKTYRSVAAAIANNSVADASCIDAREVSEAQFASLDYFLAHRLRSEAATTATACAWRLTQGTQTESVPRAGWQKIWEGARPGDKSERFRLYRRL